MLSKLAAMSPDSFSTPSPAFQMPSAIHDRALQRYAVSVDSSFALLVGIAQSCPKTLSPICQSDNR